MSLLTGQISFVFVLLSEFSQWSYHAIYISLDILYFSDLFVLQRTKSVSMRQLTINTSILVHWRVCSNVESGCQEGRDLKYPKLGLREWERLSNFARHNGLLVTAIRMYIQLVYREKDRDEACVLLYYSQSRPREIMSCVIWSGRESFVSLHE